MNKQTNRDSNYMYQMWETSHLTNDYSWGQKLEKQKMLREIVNDDITPKKHDFSVQNELHSKIRNDEDYDDWEYGTEPLYESKNP